jgi:hypothetical protein
MDKERTTFDRHGRLGQALWFLIFSKTSNVLSNVPGGSGRQRSGTPRIRNSLTKKQWSAFLVFFNFKNTSAKIGTGGFSQS